MGAARDGIASSAALTASAPSSVLFSPIKLRQVEFRNRCVVAPMQMYAASEDGTATDWHFQHLAKFAIGGAGAILTEGLAIEPEGRNTYRDLGIWSDTHIQPLQRIVSFLKENGSLAGAQLHHSGPRASRQLPWDGLGPLSAGDALRGEAPWRAKGPSAIPYGRGWPAPHELSKSEIARLVEQFGDAAKRCESAGFDFVEVHAGHDYLIHSFLSPRFNHRRDMYGGSLAGRMRLALEVAERVRGCWPANKPIFFRLSCVDRHPHGWTLDETVALVGALAERGVDLIDCSSSGSNSSVEEAEPRTLRRPQKKGFQVAFARHVRDNAGMPTMAVGLILDGQQAEDLLARGDADLVAIGREALFNPHWALHASRQCGADSEWCMWPPAYGWWLRAREQGGVAD